MPGGRRPRHPVASRPAPRLLLGALQSLVGAGALRGAELTSTAEQIAAEAAHGDLTHGQVTTQAFTDGAARATRVTALDGGGLLLDYERGVQPEVDEFFELLADAPDGITPELDYQLTWAIMRPRPRSNVPALVRLEVKLSSLPTPLRVVIEPAHQPALWSLALGAQLAIAMAAGGLVGFGLGPIPDPPELAQLLEQLAVPLALPAPGRHPDE